MAGRLEAPNVCPQATSALATDCPAQTEITWARYPCATRLQGGWSVQRSAVRGAGAVEAGYTTRHVTTLHSFPTGHRALQIIFSSIHLVVPL